MTSVFWPYRPRESHPAVPRWLMVLLLIVAVGAWVMLMNLAGHQPDYGPAP
jgi:hypothetical protein